jgi:gamma-glutamyltranspeptidase
VSRASNNILLLGDDPANALETRRGSPRGEMVITTDHHSAVGISRHWLITMSTASSSIRHATPGAVTCELSSVSALSASLLQAGGSAADAIIAAVLCVGVINSHHTGIGGGGFALIRTQEGCYEAVDFRNAAPVSLNLHVLPPTTALTVIFF